MYLSDDKVREATVRASATASEDVVSRSISEGAENAAISPVGSVVTIFCVERKMVPISEEDETVSIYLMGKCGDPCDPS